MKRLVASLLVLTVVLIFACQKETSFESGNTASEGLLLSDVTGDCLPKTVTGVYVQGTPLNGTTEFIGVQLTITTPGSYTVFSDTVNGVHFRAVGVTAGGTVTINLRGNGTPSAAGIFNYAIQYNGQVCNVPITFLPTGAGGPATFALAGSPGVCTGALVNGSYGISVPLNASNTATISVTVSAIGTYSITTPAVNGMTFSGTGAFATTGPNTIVLNGTGIPTTNGDAVFPLTAGTSNCNFTVNVGNVAIGSLGGGPGACTPSTVNGIYMASTPLAAGNTVSVQTTITTPGVYNITTDNVNGMSFTGTGTIVGGSQNIVLTGTGTPTAAGSFTYTVTFGTSTCTFSVTVMPLVIDYFPRTVGSNWSYEINDDADDSLYRVVNPSPFVALGNTYTIFMSRDAPGPLDSSGYYRKNGTDYFEFFDAGGYIGFDNELWGEYIFLKDAAINTNWKSAAFAGTITVPPPTPLTIRFSYTIKQKDISVNFTTSAGIMNFSNVIVVEEKFEQETAPGTWTDITPLTGSGLAYYARNIGLIKYELLDPAGTVTDYQKLRRFQVN